VLALADRPVWPHPPGDRLRVHCPLALDGLHRRPGIKVDGVIYESNEAPIEDFPEAWAWAAILDLPASISEGGRYEAIRTATAKLYNRGLERDQIWPIVRPAAAAPRLASHRVELRQRYERAWARSWAPRRAAIDARGSGTRARDRVSAAANDELDDQLLAEATVGPPAGSIADRLRGLLGEIVESMLSGTSASRAGLLASLASVAGAFLATTTEFFGTQTSSLMVTSSARPGQPSRARR
jgi:hypothetical protein